MKHLDGSLPRSLLNARFKFVLYPMFSFETGFRTCIYCMSMLKVMITRF